MAMTMAMLPETGNMSYSHICPPRGEAVIMFAHNHFISLFYRAQNSWKSGQTDEYGKNRTMAMAMSMAMLPVLD